MARRCGAASGLLVTDRFSRKIMANLWWERWKSALFSPGSRACFSPSRDVSFGAEVSGAEHGVALGGLGGRTGYRQFQHVAMMG
jgi:hypothetical protein